MDIAVSGVSSSASQTREGQQRNASVSPTSGFFFTSPFRSLVTEGCFRRVTTPAADGDNLSGEFQQMVKQAFASARQVGIAHPVLCGAIPFDTRQPSALYIPQDVQWIDRQDVLNQPAAITTCSADIRSLRELPQQQEFMRMVTDAVAATSAPELDKIVLSRLLEIETQQPLDRQALLARMIVQNPQGYHFHVPLEQGALFGASPELLLRKSGNQFYSNPLAGSARRERDSQQDNAISRTLLASSKDLYEHRVVTQGMQQVLAPRSRHLHIPDSPELLSTPTLWHLSTPIDGEVADRAENALSLACLLHPTPALCGSPMLTARDLIAELEPFDRGLFGGIVGWCDEQGNGEWVVTIRCGTVNANRVRLFAGAGIVPDSCPQSEWRETGVKLNTMLRALGLDQ